MPRRYKNGLTLEGQRGRGFGTPVAVDDAANKAYVDAVSDFSGFVSGRYYVPVGHGQPIGGSAAAANTLYLLYGYIKRKVTISALGARITTGVSGSQFQLAVYNHSAALGGPSTLAGSTDVLAGSTVGLVNGNLLSNANLEMGGYWFACNQSAALVFLAQTYTSPHQASMVGNVGGASDAIPAGTGNGSQNIGLQTNATFGTMPSDLSAASFSAATLTRNPMMQFLVA